MKLGPTNPKAAEIATSPKSTHFNDLRQSPPLVYKLVKNCVPKLKGGRPNGTGDAKLARWIGLADRITPDICVQHPRTATRLHALT